MLWEIVWSISVLNLAEYGYLANAISTSTYQPPCQNLTPNPKPLNPKPYSQQLQTLQCSAFWPCMADFGICGSGLLQRQWRDEVRLSGAGKGVP